MKIWKAISEVGLSDKIDPDLRRHVILCNRVSIILFASSVIIMAVAISYFGVITSILLSAVSTLLLLSPILLNHFGLTTLSRIWLIIMLTIPSTTISIFDKLDHPQFIEESEYFQYRVVLITSAIYPFLLFSLRERSASLVTLLLAFGNLILQDPIHNYFNVGYYQVGFSDGGYSWVNYISVFAFMILVGSTYFLKYSFEKTNATNDNLISQLTQQQQHLEDANRLIRQQRETLSQENLELNRELVEKNNQLSETNQELIKHNNELQQFSYSVSHNLRGPIASLKGIINLVDTAQLGENQELFRHLQRSTDALESTVRDLNHIIDVRNEVTRFRQRLFLMEEITQVKALLQREIDEHNVSLRLEFPRSFSVYSVKSMLSSVLYNLISNAIKYRSPERKPLIVVKASDSANEVVIDIEDNGLGIDLEKYSEKLFGLYKRFHTHTEGKGLGLFLVKLQIENLGGSIELKSLPGSGTRFSIHLPTPPNYDQQVLIDNDAALLYFDASISCLTVNWKRPVTADEFQIFINKALEFMRIYRTPNWMSNIMKATHRDEAELNRIRQEKNLDLLAAGLKRIAVIMPRKLYANNEYEERVEVISQAYTLDMQFFDTPAEARLWIDHENRMDLSSAAPSPS